MIFWKGLSVVKEHGPLCWPHITAPLWLIAGAQGSRMCAAQAWSHRTQAALARVNVGGAFVSESGRVLGGLGERSGVAIVSQIRKATTPWDATLAPQRDPLSCYRGRRKLS